MVHFRHAAELGFTWYQFRESYSLIPNLSENPGRRLRRIRERLCLKYRDVEQASQEIARHRKSQEFSIGLSRLADIECKGTLPSLYRMYSLCVIYGLNFNLVLSWYGIELNDLALDAARLSLRETRPIGFKSGDQTVDGAPMEVDPDLDLSKTFYLNPHVRRWGKLPLAMLSSLDLKSNRYAFIGTDDWFMYPIVPPGSFVQIDETKKKITNDTISQEHERPIHFIEHRQGYRCGWCTEKNGFLIVQPHSASNMPLEIFRFPGEADILGQIVGVAKRLDLGKRRHVRS